jgi:hypothetical protein
MISRFTFLDVALTIRYYYWRVYTIQILQHALAVFATW